MTGCLLLTPADHPAEKHTHIVFHLSSGDELRFSDTRRFGRFGLTVFRRRYITGVFSRQRLERLIGDVTQLFKRTIAVGWNIRQTVRVLKSRQIYLFALRD